MRLGWRLLVSSSRRNLAAEDGAGTMLSLALLAILISVTFALSLRVSTRTNQALVISVAQLAATSASDALSGYRTGHPCEVAGQVAELNFSKLTSCTLYSSGVAVKVSYRGLEGNARADFELK